MSEVTNLILTFTTLEDEEARMQDVNSFEYRGLRMNLISADFDKDMEKGYSWYGGTKFLEAVLYVGVFNYFPLEQFIEYLKKIKWDEPENVQLFIKEQTDFKFRLISLE